MSPNIQHLGLSFVVLSRAHLLEIAQTVPKLKSLELQFCRKNSNESDSRDDDADYAEFLRSFQFLERLSLDEGNVVFHERKSDCRLPHSLKHLALCYVTNVEEILHAAKECKNLEGLNLSYDSYTEMNIQAWQDVCEMKNLKYLAVSKIGDVDAFETVLGALPQLKALDVKCEIGCEKVISAITTSCRQLEHLSLSYGTNSPAVWGENQISDLEHAEFLLLATLPNLRSISVSSPTHPRHQITELISKFIGHLRIEYISINYKYTSVDPEILRDILYHCKNIRSIGINFGLESQSEAYPKICQVVDDIDKERSESLTATHQDVEIMCQNDMDSYKWLKIKRKISHLALREKWHDSFLSAGKPKWATLYFTDHLASRFSSD